MMWAAFLFIITFASCASFEQNGSDSEKYFIKIQNINEPAAQIKKCDNFIKKFPLSDLIFDIYIIKIKALFKQGKYPETLAAIEAYNSLYGVDAKNYNQLLRIQFFCCYNSVTNALRSYEMLEKTIEIGESYEDALNESDQEFKAAFKDAKERLAYYYHQIMHMLFEQGNYVGAILNAQILITEFKTSRYACEAYYRIIEFLFAQKNDLLLKDAISLYFEMKENFGYNFWAKEAYNLLNSSMHSKEIFVINEQTFCL